MLEECRLKLLVTTEFCVERETPARLLLVDFIDVAFPTRPVVLFPRELVALENRGRVAVL